MPPVRTMIRSPGRTSPTGTATLPSVVSSQTFVHLQRHRPGKVGDGLFVRPFVEQLADAEQEDDRARRFKVSAQDRYGNGCRVEHRHFDLPVQQTADAVAQETERADHGTDRAQWCGQDELSMYTGGRCGK